MFSEMETWINLANVWEKLIVLDIFLNVVSCRSSMPCKASLVTSHLIFPSSKVSEYIGYHCSICIAAFKPWIYALVSRKLRAMVPLEL